VSRRPASWARQVDVVVAQHEALVEAAEVGQHVGPDGQVGSRRKGQEVERHRQATARVTRAPRDAPITVERLLVQAATYQVAAGRGIDQRRQPAGLHPVVGVAEGEQLALRGSGARVAGDVDTHTVPGGNHA
jgi:hypothetical protein